MSRFTEIDLSRWSSEWNQYVHLKSCGKTIKSLISQGTQFKLLQSLSVMSPQHVSEPSVEITINIYR